jgi:peptidyl-dipeptidase A
MRDWMTTFVDRVRPLEIAVNRAWWDAAVRGDPADYERLEQLRNALDAEFREPALFRALESEREDPSDDPLRARAVQLLWLEALPRQVDPSLSERINRLSTEIERDFATYRPPFERRQRSQNDLEEVLTRETNGERLRGAWEALKSVGPIVAPRLQELVELRNESAHAVGHDDFWHLKLALYEQDPDAIVAFYDRMADLTEAPYVAFKEMIDERLATRLVVDPGELMPWHYQDPFFQEAPSVFGVDLDRVYASIDIVAVASRFFREIGLPVEEILARSSLRERRGKDPHAFATDIDREGDVRVLLNLRANERWMGTTLHELGHAVYDEKIDRALPWLLRQPAHTVSTEAIAMLFGRLSKSLDWMADMRVLEPTTAEELREAVALELRCQMLIFSRWAQVMARFERALYADPDHDLEDTWWSLVERYQGLTRPDRPAGAADHAAKIHVVVAPVYYHNYLLGECFASQIDVAIRDEILGTEATYCGEERVGQWLVERVFEPGARYHYDELARRATGSPVTADAFADQFVIAAAP